MKKIIRGNVSDHLLALLLALVLWFFVKSTTGTVRQVDTNSRRFSGIVIETRNRSPELDLVKPVTATVTLTIRAPQDILDKLTAQDLEAYVDLRNLREGTHQLSVRVAVPAGVEVQSATPQRVDVALEEIISTQVPVTLSLAGAPAEDYFAPPGVVEPSSVIVTGGRSSVGSMAPFVIVLDVTNLTDTVTANVPLEPLDAQGQTLSRVTVNPSQVQYRQPIYPVKTVPLEVLRQGGLAPGIKELRFELSPAQARIAAPRELLQSINTLRLRVNTVSVTDNATLEITPELPAGTYLVTPQVVTVRIMVVSEP